MTGRHLAKGGNNALGYRRGGGQVTQASSRTTAVTVNALSGAITLVGAAGSATPFSFTVNNNLVEFGDVPIVCQQSGTDAYDCAVTAVGNGNFRVTVVDLTGTTNEAPVLNFIVLKAARS